MKILIDSANITEIKEIYEYYPVDGVTTNPTILAREKSDPYQTLSEIREFIGDDELHVQVISLTAEAMIEEAYTIVERLGKNTFVKIPVIPEGLKAIKELSTNGINVTATAIYNQMQGYLAAKAGAKYVAPYVNRIDNLGYNGELVASQIDKMITDANLNCEVLAASFKNSQQIINLGVAAIPAVTIAPDSLHQLIKNSTITDAINQFKSDFETLCSENSTMKDYHFKQ